MDSALSPPAPIASAAMTSIPRRYGRGASDANGTLRLARTLSSRSGRWGGRAAQGAAHRFGKEFAMTHGALHVSAIALGAAAFLAMSPLSTASADSPASSASVSAPSGAALPSTAPAPAPSGENATGSVAASTPSAPAPAPSASTPSLAEPAPTPGWAEAPPTRGENATGSVGGLRRRKRAGAQAERFDGLAQRARADARLGGGPCAP